MMMFLFAFTGVMRADELTVHNGTTTNQNVPIYGYWADAFNKCEMVYPASELGIMTGGQISKLTFYAQTASVSWGSANFQVFVKEVADASISSYTGTTDATIVYTGNLSVSGNQMVVTFDTPYNYEGGNLLVGVYEIAKGSYSRVYWYGETVTGASVQGYSSSALNSCSATAYNFLPKTTFEYTAGTVPSITLTTDPAILDLGDRPNNAWMVPFQFGIYNNGTSGTISSIEANAPFVASAELPAAIGYKETIPAEITIGETEATGATTGEILVMFEGAKEFTTFNVNANLYTAETPDVWEMAQEVTSFPYTNNAPATIHHNYNIPGAATDALDAVYKVTLDEDAMLNVNVGNSGVSAIYTEDFQEVGGPDEENAYTYEGPVVGPGPINTWFYYDWTGSGTYLGSATWTGVAFGYEIPASYLQENGFGACAITTVETFALPETYASTYYQLFILQGGDEPDINNVVYVQDAEYTPGQYFDVVLDEPLFLGDQENIWIMFVTDCCRFYCGITPEDPTGMAWYSTTLETWYSTSSYTPIIYTQFLELPTGRQLTVDPTLNMRKLNGSEAGELSSIETNVTKESRAQRSIAMKGNRAETPEGTFVPAGTYYVVAAAATAPFSVEMSVTDVPAPEPAVMIWPIDGDTDITAPLILEWTLGNYTQEMQVLFGTQFPPTDILIDWTDELVESAIVASLENNKTYFIKINERNSAGVTESEVFGFTTIIDPVEDFAVVSENLYPGDAAEFTWTANRTLQGYNLYQDGVKINTEPITGTEYAVEGLAYNMTGYNFQIASLYAEGESELSEPIIVKMTGNGNVSGTVYEQDEVTVVPGVTVEYRGTDEYGEEQSFTFTTDENGAYTGEVLAGNYQTYAYSDAYQETPGPAVTVAFEDVLTGIDIIVYEYYFPLGQIRATEQTDENNVLVEWDWTPGEMVVDFETGDFSQAEFTLPATYPWAITTTNPHDGTYCMKSTCEAVASGISAIEATIDVPFDAKMGFWVRTSSESNYDKFHFYIDGTEQGSALSGQNPYAYKEYTVAQGTHTYKWTYEKDGSVNSNDDCIYVDDITMYRQDIPAPPVVGATDYNFDDGTLMGWTNIDADGDGNVWVSSANPGIYHNATAVLSGTGHNASEAYAISGSYANQTGAVLYPDNYLVSPQISAQDGALIRFYVCAQDANYAAEHYGVAVSTTGNTNQADFTTIQEWTLSAKNAPAPAAENSRDIRGITAQGAWYEQTVDLSDYAGQDIYVAIRHFNCSDQFILNLDDITLATGGSKEIVRNDRSFQHFNLYRRDIKNGEDVAEPICIAQPGEDTFSYLDEAWADLPYGAYQWGIQAYYEGNAPSKNRDEFTYDFEGGLNDWTVLTINTGEGEWVHSDDNPGGYDYTTYAHGGTGFAMCYSFVDYVGSYNTDSYLISPQKYSIDGSSTISFWADNANDDYPEEFSVCISTAANPTSAADFTEVWSGGAKGKAKGGEMVRHTTNRYDNWRSHSVDLSAYAGQEVWIAFHDVNEDAYEVWIDDVTITAGGGGTTPVIPTPTGDGLSEILWSNTIEKDMYSDVTVKVILNNGQTPVGVNVALGELTGTTDETGIVVFENVRKGDYELSATMTEFTDYTETVTIDDNEETFNITLMEIVGPVADLYVSPTGWAMWSGATSGGTTPVGPVGPTTSVTYDFEADFAAQEILDWTTIDANNDGYDWYVRPTALTTTGHNGSQGFVTSFSYDGSVGVTPDNYLVSPQGQYSSISFWACAQDAAYPAEKFGVAVSTTGNTNASDFTTLQSWVMTAKAPANKLERGMNVTGEWYEYTVDLSAYAGQNIYVAIRHFDCYDQFRLNVDDITLAVAAKDGAKADRGALSFKVMLDGVYEGETPNGYFQHNVEGFEEGSVHTTSVAGIYATGMGDWTDYTWTYTSCENFDAASNVTAEQSENVVNISWEMPNGSGPTPPPGGGSSFTEGFEGGLNGWTVLTLNSDGGEWVHSDNNPGGYDYASHAHGGSGFALCYSFVDYVGAYNTDSYLITPQAYSIVNGSTLTFFADNANDSYPENFSVCVSTAATPASAADFTQVWSGAAKGTGNSGATVRHTNNRYDNWRSHSVDLSAYAGQTVWIAFHDVNYDAYEVWIDDVELSTSTKGGSRTVIYEPHFVTDPGAMANGADASWTKGSQTTWGPNCNNGSSYKLGDDFTLDAATTISEIEVYGYQTGSTTTSTFTGLYAQIYNGAPNAGGTVVWGDETTNIMTATSFTNCYRGTDNDASGTTRPIMAITASGLNISLEAGTYYLVWSLTGSASSGPWAAPEALPSVGNTGNGLQYNGSAWTSLTDSGSSTPYGGAFKLVGEGGTPGPGPIPGEFGILGAYVFRNGELISGTTPLTTTTFVDTDAPAGDNEYCVRVVYDGALDTTYFAMSCPVCAEVEYECIPVNNLVAEYTYNSADDYGVTLTWDCEYADDVLYYNIFYSDTIVSGITELEYYVEMTGNPGEYTFSVTAVYPNCESEPVYADVNVTSVNDINGKVVLYPNPTNSNVTIEAAGMKHITVVNALGQVVYDTDVNADMLQLNLGQYKPGIYMVRINTEEGMSVKRVTVVK